jgi:hypothetical protein
MTRLYIDKQEIAQLPADLKSMEQVLKLVEEDHLPADMIIREIQLDGSPLLQDELAATLSEPMAHVDTIEVFTSSLREVAADSIGEAIQYLERVEAAIPSLIAGLRARSESEVAGNLKQFYEGFYWIHLLLTRLEQSFGIPLREVKVGNGSAQEYCVRLAALLREVVGAHEKNDFGLLADLLEYEFFPLMPTCREIFAAIKGRMCSRP